MNVFKSIKEFLSVKRENNATPEGICPNCWGRQKYEGEFFKAIHKEKIDLNNIDLKKGWIEAYAAKNLTGILMKEEGTTQICPSCSLTYE